MPPLPSPASSTASSSASPPRPASAADAGFPGDRARRRAAYGLALLALGLALSWFLFTNLASLWPHVAALEGTPFLLAATAFGGALALAPLAAALGFVFALWFGVESVYRPRRQPSPLLDRLIVGGGLLLWFTPMLACLGVIGRALQQGRIHFVRPPRDYFLATDPIAFWQSIGFWGIIAAATGFLAWAYWRGKLGSRPGQS